MSDLLVITGGLGLPPYAVRGVIQTYAPIAGAVQMERDVNGNLEDISDPLFQKYSTQISGTDQQPPAVDGVWPGRSLTVECAAEWSYLTGTAGAPFRPVVPGSSRVDGLWTFYRPILTMKLINFDVQWDEWGAISSWTLQLEEV